MWALGATLYAAIEGRPPFDGQTLVAIVGAVLTRPHQPPQHSGPLTQLTCRPFARIRQKPSMTLTANYGR